MLGLVQRKSFYMKQSKTAELLRYVKQWKTVNPMFLNLFQGIDSSTAGLLKPTTVFR